MQIQSNVVWRSPVPSTAYLKDVGVQLRPGREIALTFEFEGRDKIRKGELQFKDVVHHRTTFFSALRADIIQVAYDKVVDMGSSGLLAEITSALRANQHDHLGMRHFYVCFDDGPSFDFVAKSFETKIE